MAGPRPGSVAVGQLHPRCRSFEVTDTAHVNAAAFSLVLVTHYFPAHGGGVEKVAEQLARRMAGDGITITWCASDTDPAPDLDGVQAVPMRTINVVERATGSPYPLWAWGSLRRLARLIRAANAVHVHDGIYFGSLAGAVLAKRFDKRLVVTQHIGQGALRPPLSWAVALANRVAAHLVLKRADAVAFISPAVRSYFESIVGPERGFHYVANGVDTDIFHPVAETPQSCRARLGFDSTRPLLLFVGRFVPVKRLHLVRAIAEQRPDWQWCVIGHGPEQPTGWRLPNVNVLAPMRQAALADFYRAADLLVIPSEREGFPLVVQEAMACGLPVCITAEVAAGGALPPALWVRLPDDEARVADEGVAALAAALQAPAPARQRLREDCAAYAASSWSWWRSCEQHLRWLKGDTR